MGSAAEVAFLTGDFPDFFPLAVGGLLALARGSLLPPSIYNEPVPVDVRSEFWTSSFLAEALRLTVLGFCTSSIIYIINILKL